MIEILNNIIMDDVQDIMLELRKQLEINGIKRFSKFIDSGNNLMTCCPFHKEGQEKKPSFGIHKKDGTCHCFGCGWAGSLSEMISNCFGYDDFGNYGTKWLTKNFLTVQVEERSDIEIDTDRRNSKRNTNATVCNDIVYIDETELDSYRQYHSYMWKRKMTPEVVEIFDIGFDEKTNCLTFPVRDIHGNTLFVAKRSVKTKFFNYPNNVEKPVYGLYELAKAGETVTSNGSEFRRVPKYEEIIICESMINAITCWVYGKYAVALNGTGTQYQYEQLRKMPNRKFILALDPDDAGNRGRQKLKKVLYNKLVTEYIIPEGKDINDLSKEEFDNLKEVF